MGSVKMLGQDSLERAVREAGIDVPPVWFDEVGSTNDEARALAERGAPEWTVVAAGHQTAGRGRLGRSWIDVPGKALLFSVILRPQKPPAEVPLLGLSAAVHMIGAARLPHLRSKWPNDLVIGRRKVGGILTEAALEGGRVLHVVVGLGINVALDRADLPGSLRSTATSLSVDPHALLTGFMKLFVRGTQRPGREIVADYRAVCATLGRRVRATTTSGRIVEGTAVDIDERGLIVDTDGGHEVVASGEVVQVR
jgi:BirA family biotin operon repressor/biotin-[acetyl-CoA-carboxylase] ligase